MRKLLNVTVVVMSLIAVSGAGALSGAPLAGSCSAAPHADLSDKVCDFLEQIKEFAIILALFGVALFALTLFAPQGVQGILQKLGVGVQGDYLFGLAIGSVVLLSAPSIVSFFFGKTLCS